CSLGPVVKIHGSPTGFPSLWTHFHDVPVLSSAVPTRWALAVTPIVGLLLAMGVAEVQRRAVALPRGRASTAFQTVAAMVVVVALLPIAPTALPAEKIAPAPAFVSQGIWEQYTTGGRSVLFVPTPNSANPAAIRWAAGTLTRMSLAKGYFLVPAG